MKGRYVPLSVAYREDDAVLGIEPLAELLFVRSLAFCKAREDSGGGISSRQLRLFGADLGAYGVPVDDLVAQLVRENLWIETGDGWLIRSWLEWNGNESSEHGRRGNHVRWHEDRGFIDESCPFCRPSGAMSGAIGGDVGGESQDKGRERKGQEAKGLDTAATGGEPSSKPRKKPATAAPASFEVDSDLRQWAATKAPRVDLSRETDRWLDHHRAKGSTFSDWRAAWRTWMSRAEQYLGPVKAGGRPVPMGANDD